MQCTIPQIRAKVPERSLQWRHNERDGVANHKPHDCILNRLFKAHVKLNIKAPPHWPLWGVFPPWPVNSRHKGPVTRKMCPFENGRNPLEVFHRFGCTKWVYRHSWDTGVTLEMLLRKFAFMPSNDLYFYNVYNFSLRRNTMLEPAMFSNSSYDSS